MGSDILLWNKHVTDRKNTEENSFNDSELDSDPLYIQTSDKSLDRLHVSDQRAMAGWNNTLYLQKYILYFLGFFSEDLQGLRT